MHPLAEPCWLNAADPMQPWGKLLAHEPERSFINVPGTVAAFRDGLPVAVFERQGRTLRMLGPERQQDGGDREGTMPEDIDLSGMLGLFAEAFHRGRIFPGKKRVSVKEYPARAASALETGGFLREIQDYVLYR